MLTYSLKEQTWSIILRDLIDARKSRNFLKNSSKRDMPSLTLVVSTILLALLLNFVSFRLQVQVAARSVCEAARNLGCGGMKLRDADHESKSCE